MSHVLTSQPGVFSLHEWCALVIGSTFIATVMLVIARLLSRRNAAKAHAMSQIAVLALLILPPCMVLVGHFSSRLTKADPVQAEQAKQATRLVELRADPSQKVAAPSADAFQATEAPPKTRVGLTRVPLSAADGRLRRGQERLARSVTSAGHPWLTQSLISKMGGLAIGIYGCGLALSWFVLTFQALRLIRCCRGAAPCGDDLQRLVASMACQFELRCSVVCRVSDTIRQPLVFGLLRPTVLLPSDASGWSGDFQRMVLRHELAHLRRRDHLWLPLFAVARAVYWPHPVVRRLIRDAETFREYATDQMAIAAPAQRAGYAECLVTMVRTGSALPVGLAMGTTQGLSDRVTRILRADDSGVVPGRRSHLVTVAVAVLLAIVAAGAVGAGPESPRSTATVKLADSELGDTNGQPEPPVEKTIASVERVIAQLSKLPEYSHLTTDWVAELFEEKVGGPSVNVGVRVLDHEGRKVKGALVMLLESKEQLEIRFRLPVAPRDDRPLRAIRATGPDGKCVFAGVQMSHPSAQQHGRLASFVVALLPGFPLSQAQLLKTSHSQDVTLRLEPPRTRTLTVKDASGNPVSQLDVGTDGMSIANVGRFMRGDNLFLDDRLAPIAKTGDSGECQFVSLPEYLNVRFQSVNDAWTGFFEDRFAPLKFEPTKAFVVTRVSKTGVPGTLVFRDSVSGSPIAGVRFQHEQTEERISDQDGKMSTTWPTWVLQKNVANVDIAPFLIPKPWVNQRFGISTEAVDQPVQLKLTRGEVVNGEVKDEATGEGIPGVVVEAWSSATPPKQSAAVNEQPYQLVARTDADGKFEMMAPPGKLTIRLRGPIEGHLAPIRNTRDPDQVIPDWMSTELDVQAKTTNRVTFRLPPAPPIMGRVIGKDGQPQAGILVICHRKEWERVGIWREAGLPTRVTFNTATTDAQGRFELLPPAGVVEPLTVAAIQGLKRTEKTVQVDPRTGQTPNVLIDLSEAIDNGAVIEGRVTRGAEPVPDCKITLYRVQPGKTKSTIRNGELVVTGTLPFKSGAGKLVTTTDENGEYRFVIDEGETRHLMIKLKGPRRLDGMGGFVNFSGRRESDRPMTDRSYFRKDFKLRE